MTHTKISMIHLIMPSNIWYVFPLISKVIIGILLVTTGILLVTTDQIIKATLVTTGIEKKLPLACANISVLNCEVITNQTSATILEEMQYTTTIVYMASLSNICVLILCITPKSNVVCFTPAILATGNLLVTTSGYPTVHIAPLVWIVKSIVGSGEVCSIEAAFIILDHSSGVQTRSSDSFKAVSCRDKGWTWRLRLRPLDCL